MVNLFTIILYLIACALAWALHELAHYCVHSVYTNSVTIGFTRWGPYTHAVYEEKAPSYAISIGSIAPTLIYTPIIIVLIGVYLSTRSIPDFGLVEWSFILTPIVILIVPTVGDLKGFLLVFFVDRPESDNSG